MERCRLVGLFSGIHFLRNVRVIVCSASTSLAELTGICALKSLPQG